MKSIKSLPLFLCILILFCSCAKSEAAIPSAIASYPNIVSSAPSLEESVSSLTAPFDEDSSFDAASEPSKQTFAFSFDRIPEYSNKPFISLNNNFPTFSSEELTAIGCEKYAPLDSLGRCGVAFAVCGMEIMPKKNEERKSIHHIKPSGWIQTKYDHVTGKYLYNRCHLLGWQLSSENDNPRNLITGTRYMNTQGMLPFENMIADYIKETENHVAYRVTPRFQKNDLVAKGVELEAYSIEDEGEGICFHVYVYNVQPGITINYSSGKSQSISSQNTQSYGLPSTSSSPSNSETASSSKIDSKTVYITPTGKRYHYSPTCGGKNSKKSNLSSAKSLGLTPCKKCTS